MRAPDVSVVVPTFNGLAWLRRNLGSWRAGLAGLEAAGARGELVVVDDGSVDGTRDFLAREAGLRVLRTGRNAGFGAAANAGVRAARGAWAYLLNNDVRTEPEFLATLLPYLPRGDLFAVVSRSAVPDGRVESATRLDLRGGVRVAQPGLEDPAFDAEAPGPTLHVSGGFGLFHRARFLELGGFDPAFHPFYWEDVDLCARAWRMGRPSWYEPASRVRHAGHGTVGALWRPDEVREIYERGRRIFAERHLGAGGGLPAALPEALVLRERGADEREHPGT